MAVYATISVTKRVISSFEERLPGARPGGRAIDGDVLFGQWLRRRRRALDLTREELAARVGCSVSALRKFEADELRPSRQTAERLAQYLQLTPEEQAAFVQFARVGLDEAPPAPPIPPAAQLPARPLQNALDLVVATPAVDAATARPSGTVTFLFTDIEGSTRLWEQHPDLMQEAFRQQEALLRQAIAVHGGYAYKMIGDAFQAAFATASDALDAAVAAQRALYAAAWSTPRPLRVRMALDSGVVEERGDDYVGPLLNRTARLMAAGHGGQILLSAAARQLVRGQLPPDITLRDLGAHRLKDLTHSEQVFQALAAGLPSEFPPLRTTASQMTALPHPATPFVGRAAELAELGVLLDDPACRLVTLSGPGGIGKTRLALASAAERAERYPHSVWFVNLAPLSAAEGVIFAIADTFKLSGLGMGDSKQALQNYLREKALLLILDNFEHVLDAADLVADLLAAAPGLQVLATSRERLRLRAERVYEVRGLPIPLDATQGDADAFDALRLFVACVRHSHPQYTLDPADKVAVAQICRMAAGMPLGIELAAAWVPTLPVATIATELATSLDVLETTMRDVPERHRSARAVFEHSWNLLATEEQTLFRQLAVFQGGFTFAAAQQIAGAKLGTLARLIDTSLVRIDRDGRYDTHELLRQFAAEKLQADPAAATSTRERHSAFYLALIQHKNAELNGRQQLAALDEIEREFENVRGACDWALQRGQWERLRKPLRALAFFIAVRSHLQAAIALFQRVIDTVAAVESGEEETAERQGLAAFALAMQSAFFGMLGQIDQRVNGLERSRAAIYRYGTPHEIATHCVLYATTRSDPKEARALYERSLAIFREIGATWDEGWAIANMGYFAFGRGETLEAKWLHAEALALYRPIGELQGTTGALLDLGRVAYALGEYDEGRRLLQESLTLQQAVGSKVGTAECLEVLGEIAYVQGQFAEAEAWSRQELAILRDLGYREKLSWSYARLGAAVLAQERLGDAAGLLAQALAIAEHCGDVRGIACAHKELGYLALKQGAHDTARRHWRTAIGVAWRVQNRAHLLVTLDALIGLATLIAQADNLERAVELFTLVCGAASIDRRTETKAEQLLVELEERLPVARFAAAQARGQALELGATVAAVVAEGPA